MLNNDSISSLYALCGSDVALDWCGDLRKICDFR